jgi:hypothetical protein
VKETAQAYKLYNELLGIKQKNIKIKFTDQQTLTIKGCTKHLFTKGIPPAGFVKEPETLGIITKDGKNDAQKSHNNNTNTSTAVVKTDKGNKKPDHRY